MPAQQTSVPLWKRGERGWGGAGERRRPEPPGFRPSRKQPIAVFYLSCALRPLADDHFALVFLWQHCFFFSRVSAKISRNDCWLTENAVRSASVCRVHFGVSDRPLCQMCFIKSCTWTHATLFFQVLLGCSLGHAEVDAKRMIEICAEMKELFHF